jgi:hypothetical protein
MFKLSNGDRLIFGIAAAVISISRVVITEDELKVDASDVPGSEHALLSTSDCNADEKSSLLLALGMVIDIVCVSSTGI